MRRFPVTKILAALKTAKITDDISTADVSDETPQDSGENRPSGRDLKPDKIADGSASSEAAQQTMQIPALEAAALAAALEERNAAQAIRQTMQNSGDMPQDSDMEFWGKTVRYFKNDDHRYFRSSSPSNHVGKRERARSPYP